MSLLKLGVIEQLKPKPNTNPCALIEQNIEQKKLSLKRKCVTFKQYIEQLLSSCANVIVVIGGKQYYWGLMN